MYSSNLDIKHSKTNGHIWHRSHKSSEEKTSFEKRRLTHNGFLLRVNFNPSLDSSKFINAAFDSSSHQIAATDHLGKLFLFELTANRYRLITRLPSRSCAITWNFHESGKILISLTNNNLCYVDVVTKNVIKLSGHASPATHLSIHSRDNLALSNSNRETILWDLNSCHARQKLDVKQDVELLQALFAGEDNLITCFRDNSIFVWNINTLLCVQHMKPEDSYQYRTFAVSRNGRTLLAAGYQREITIWDLELFEVVKILVLPSIIKGVKKIYVLDEWYPNTSELQVIALLSSDCVVYLIDVPTSKIIYRIRGHNISIKTCAISPSSEFAVTIWESGSFDLYDLKILSSKNVTSEGDVVATKKLNLKNNPDENISLQPYRLKAGMDTEENGNEEVMLDLGKLRSLLKNYGEYPEKYRNLIWKFLLQLPENRESYSVLEKKGIHYSFEKLEEKFPLNNDKLMEKFKTILSCLAFWSPVFGQVDYIPLFTFPFIKTITRRIECFEILAVTLINWCQNWFEFYPSIPMSILGHIERILSHRAHNLMEHFAKYKITAEIYGWSLLQSAFSEIFCKTDWLQLWDHLFSNHPSFIISVVVAYNVVSLQSLLTCSKTEDFQFYFHHQNPIDLSLVLNEAYNVQLETQGDTRIKNEIVDFIPLPKGTYPVFGKYPRHVINHQASEYERIQKGEQEYQRLKKTAEDLDKKLKNMDMEEKIWQQKLENFKEMEIRRKRLLEKEEQQHVDQRNRLVSLKRELQLKELCLLKSLRSKFSKEQQLHWQMQIQELEHKIQTKMKEHDKEIMAAMGEVREFQTFLTREKQNLELEIESELHQALKENKERLAGAGTNQEYDLGIREEISKRHEDGFKNVQSQYKNLIAADQQAMNNLYKYKCKVMEERAEEDQRLRAYMDEVAELNEKTNELEEEIVDLSGRLIKEKLKDPINSSEDDLKLLNNTVPYASRGLEHVPEFNLRVPQSQKDSLEQAFNVRHTLAQNMCLRYQK